MNINKIIAVSMLFGILSLCGCASLQVPTKPDPNEEINLSKSPIGLYVKKVYRQGGMTYSDITVRNNSGSFIGSLYIEVIVYNGNKRVGMTNHIFGSVNEGEEMVTRNPINSSGRSWSTYKYTYKMIP